MGVIRGRSYRLVRIDAPPRRRRRAAQGTPGDVGTFVEYGALEHSFVRTDFTTSSSTLADTNFTFPVKAGEVRAIDYDGIAECDSTGGSAYGIAAPAGSTIDAWLESTTLSLDDRSLEQFTTVTATPVHIVQPRQRRTDCMPRSRSRSTVTSPSKPRAS